MSSEFEKYIENIGKTGFPLEYRISLDLQKQKWNIINNRYYIDDTTNNMREIDILAYQVNLVNKTRYYTTLLISSKKSEENNWAFLTKELNQNDPNLDYFPIVNWSNDEYLGYMLNNSEWRRRMIRAVKANNSVNKIYDIKEGLFAFQEMNKRTGKVQNDKNIFSSISSLVKSLSYEVISLDKRVEHNSFYSFYLISIVDTDLIRIHFDNQDISCNHIDEIMYLNRFIVNDKDDFYRIHFVNYNRFSDVLKNYNHLHEWNVEFFSNLRDEFYIDLIEDWKKIKMQLKKHQYSMKDELNGLLQNEYHGNYKLSDFVMVYEKREKKLRISVTLDTNLVHFLNDSKKVERLMKKLLEKYFNYSGDFYFSEDDLPF